MILSNQVSSGAVAKREQWMKLDEDEPKRNNNIPSSDGLRVCNAGRLGRPPTQQRKEKRTAYVK